MTRPAGGGATRRRGRRLPVRPGLPPLTGSSTPERLRRVGLLLVLGCAVAAVVSVVSGLDRTSAVRESDTRTAALASDAAALYQSLADADATATGGYVAGGREPAQVRSRYDTDITRAAERLVHAAGLLPDGDPATAPVSRMTSQLPVYAGLMETARAYNRQGLPLGQSYLTQASRLMQSSMLPAAAELRTMATRGLAEAYRQGSAPPLAVLVLGVGLLAAVLDLALGERTRTNRLLSPGLVACAVAVTAALLWWAVAWVVAGSALAAADRHTDATTALDDARTAVLQARSNENLVLVARGGGSADRTFTELLDRVAGPDRAGGLLDAAEADGADVGDVRVAVVAWDEAHRQVRELDDSGRFNEAVQSVIGP
ncbi:MAG TPA: hypothetical protein VEZ42_19215, partial [Pseudonocardia sp.]|nr:hypothetical protein [Pseudonocardia sp.]